MEEKIPRDYLPTAFGGIALLGIALWVQILGSALFGEFQSQTSSFFHVIAYGLPIGVVILGVLLRSQMILLMVFLSSFVPGVTILPEAFDLMKGAASLRVGLSCLVYILVVSYVFALQYSPDHSILNTSATPLWKNLQQRIEVPLVYSFVFFLVLQYAVFGDALIQNTILQSYEDPTIALISISVSIFFIWCISIYLYFIVPALNFEHELAKWKKLKYEQHDLFRLQKIFERNIFPFVVIFLMLTLVIVFI